MNWLYLNFIDHNDAYWLTIIIIAICYFLFMLSYYFDGTPNPSNKDKLSRQIESSKKVFLWLIGFVMIALLVVIVTENTRKTTLPKAIYYVEHKGKQHSIYAECIVNLNISIKSAQYQMLNESEQVTLDNHLSYCLKSNDIN